MDDSPHITPGRYLTGDLPGVGGRIRQRPEDFIVEEIPLYDPCGTGEHIYLYVQKVNLSTSALVEIVARHFGVRPADVGYAGLKDRRAVTRQVLSVHVPGRRPEDFPALVHERVSVLWVDRHTNKLRRGHLRGNRFAIRIRGVPTASVLTARRVMQALERAGVPNRIGEQRFGYLQTNHLIGRAVLRGDYEGAVRLLLAPHTPPLGRPADEHEREAKALYARGRLREAARLMPPYAAAERAVLTALARGAGPREAFMAVPGVQRIFYLTAFQSAVFNSVLDRRMESVGIGALIEGDVAMIHDRGAMFGVDAATAADPETRRRLESLEISPTGPMWSARMMRAAGRVDEVERQCLLELGVTPEDLEAYQRRSAASGHRDHLDGKRRPLRVPLAVPEVEAGADEHGLYLRLSFELPAGAFATTVLQEVMKSPAADEGDGSEPREPGASAPGDAPSEPGEEDRA
jgi:tRNA pseudouridine13 synthase